MSVHAARTTVMAVGIERYAAGSDWNLQGAAAVADRFATWAVRCGVPPAQVTVACARLDPATSAAPDGVHQLEPTQSALVEAFAGLNASGCDRFLLYWCGHGVLDADDRRALFTCDATSSLLRSIDVDDLLRYLRSTSGPPGGRQMLLVDACANFVEEMHYGVGLALSRLPGAGRRHGVDQFAYFAAAQGRVSHLNHAERVTYFSDAVLRCLETEAPKDLQPSRTNLAAHVTAQLEKAGIDQAPVWWRIQTPECDERAGNVPASRRIIESARDTPLSPSQLRRLVERSRDLLGAPEWGSIGSALAARYGTGEAFELAWAAGDMPGLLANAATDEAQRATAAQLEHLHRCHLRIAPIIDTITSVTTQQVREAFFRAMPTGADTPAPRSLDEALERAAEHGLEREESPLLRLVAALEHTIGTPIDDQWYRLPLDRLSALRHAARPPDQIALLFVDLLPPDRPPDRWSWPDAVSGYLRLPGRPWTKKVVSCVATGEGVRAAVSDLLTWAHEHGPAAVRVGFAGPRALIDERPEEWQFGSVYEDARPLWHDHPTVLHLSERRVEPRYRAKILARAQRIRGRLAAGGADVCWLEQQEPAQLRMLAGGAAQACCGLRFAPGPFEGAYPQDALWATLVDGAPYMLWTDNDPLDRTAQEKELEHMMQKSFESVPEQIHRARAETGVGAVRLVWDDPDVLPNVAPLTGLGA